MSSTTSSMTGTRQVSSVREDYRSTHSIVLAVQKAAALRDALHTAFATPSQAGARAPTSVDISCTGEFL